MLHRFRFLIYSPVRRDVINNEICPSFSFRSRFYSTSDKEVGDISRKPSLNHFRLSSLHFFQDPSRSPKPFNNLTHGTDVLNHFQRTNSNIDKNPGIQGESSHKTNDASYIRVLVALFFVGICFGDVISSHIFNYSMHLTSTKQVTNIPSNIKDCIEDILLAEQAGDFQRAIIHCKRALQLFEDTGSAPEFLHYSGIAIKLAEIYERLGELDKAVNIYKEVSELYFSNLIEFDNKTTTKFSQYDFMIFLLLTSTTRYYLLASDADKPHAGKLLGFSIINSLIRLCNLNPEIFFHSSIAINYIMNNLSGYPIKPNPPLKNQISKLLMNIYIKSKLLRGDGSGELKFLLAFPDNFPVYTSKLAFALAIYMDRSIDKSKTYLPVPLMFFPNLLYGTRSDNLMKQAIYNFKTGDELLKQLFDIKDGRITKINKVPRRLIFANRAVQLKLGISLQCSDKLYQNSKNEQKTLAAKILIYSCVDLGIIYILNKQPAKAKGYLNIAKKYTIAYPNKEEIKDVSKTIDRLLKNY